jgi:hypothetical protein
MIAGGGLESLRRTHVRLRAIPLLVAVTGCATTMEDRALRACIEATLAELIERLDDEE